MADLPELLKNYPPELIETTPLGTTVYNLPNNILARNRILADALKQPPQGISGNSLTILASPKLPAQDNLHNNYATINGVSMVIPRPLGVIKG